MGREWGNGQRMRKSTENEEMEREWGNGTIMRKLTENEEIDREWGNGKRMRKSTENEEMERGWGNGKRMRKWKEIEEMEGEWGNIQIFRTLESSVESLISRYEVHFDKSHQLGEEKAHMEMFMSMNGPVLVRADPLLKRAMDKFFKDKNPRWDGAWRMYHSDETRFYPQDE